MNCAAILIVGFVIADVAFGGDISQPRVMVKRETSGQDVEEEPKPPPTRYRREAGDEGTEEGGEAPQEEAQNEQGEAQNEQEEAQNEPKGELMVLPESQQSAQAETEESEAPGTQYIGNKVTATFPIRVVRRLFVRRRLFLLQ